MDSIVVVGETADSCERFPADPQVVFDKDYAFVFVEPASIGQGVMVSFDGKQAVASIYCGADGQGVIYDLGPTRGAGLFFRVEEFNQPVSVRVVLQESLNA